MYSCRPDVFEYGENISVFENILMLVNGVQEKAILDLFVVRENKKLKSTLVIGKDNVRV